MTLMLSSVMKNIKIVEPGGHNLKLANHRCHYDLRKYFLHTNNKCSEQFTFSVDGTV